MRTSIGEFIALHSEPLGSLDGNENFARPTFGGGIVKKPLLQLSCHSSISDANSDTPIADKSLPTGDVTATSDEIDNDRTMTAADLAVETGADIDRMSDVILASTEENGSKNISDCDVRQANVERIMQTCRSTSNTSENSGNGRGSGESCQPVLEAVRFSLTDSTKSYSWSSSLPNGSRLETLSSNTVAKSETESVERGVTAEYRDNVLSPTSCGSSQTAADGSRMTVGSGDVADDVSQQDAAGSKRSNSRTLRVGDFLPSLSDASETTFGSPRVSLIERRGRPRNVDGCRLDESWQDLDRTVTITTPSPPATSI